MKKHLETIDDPIELQERLLAAHKAGIVIPADLEDDPKAGYHILDEMKFRRKEFGQTMFVVMFVDWIGEHYETWWGFYKYKRRIGRYSSVLYYERTAWQIAADKILGFGTIYQQIKKRDANNYRQMARF